MENSIMTVASEKSVTDMSGFARASYDINGVDIVVHSIGSGPALVFLHGTGTFTGFDVARSWAAQRTVIIPYHPGFGDSGDAPSLDTIEDYALHYMDLFDQLGLESFDLAGFSLGGWIAAEFAIRQPRRIRRLVLVAPAGLVVDEAPAPGLLEIEPQQLASYLAHDPAAALRYFPAAPDPGFNARLGREVSGYAKLVRNHPQGNPKLGNWLHRVAVPTLVLWGGEDRLRPTAQSEAWMTRLPNARVQLVPTTGHLVFEETPSAGRFVTDFLAG
jgi:pimeloyl-ACP methyl ester carboxylesterase